VKEQRVPQTILVVDDSASLLTLTRAQLEREGYRVVTADNGADALDEFVRSNCDAVVLDYDMPDLTGAALAKQMYALNRYAHIIMFSGVETIPPEALRYVDGLVQKGESGTALVRQLAKMFGRPETKSIFEVPGQKNVEEL
jgi:two-component system, cell cycle sensor histidine kinase and response regulator CckA